MLRVLLVNDTHKQVGSLRTALLHAGCEVVEEVFSAMMIPRRVVDLKINIVIIDAESASRDVLEQMCAIAQYEPNPMVIVTQDTQPQAMKAAIKAGVSAYVVANIDAECLAKVLEVAQARFEQPPVLISQIRQAESKLNEYKLVERAKRLLMQLRSINDSEAYYAMRKMAIDRNIRIIDVAHKLLAMNEAWA